jgi:DNA invertase Pin-like site-specific DNA recombinase
VRIVAYLRLSKHEERSHSIRTQQAALEAYLQAHPELDLVETFIDDNVSASKKPLHLRPRGARMLKFIENRAHEVRGVWAWKLDRLFRNQLDAARNRERLVTLGVGMHFSDMGGLQADDSVGNLMFGLVSATSQFEADRVSERIVENKAARKATGLVYAVPRYGYQNGEDGVRRRDEVEQKRIRYMQIKRGNGWSYQQIADALNTAGVPTKTGKGSWKRATVQRILRDVAEEGEE